MCITHNLQTNRMFPNNARLLNNNNNIYKTSIQPPPNNNNYDDSDDLPQEQNTENSMAVLPSSICKLKKARGGVGGGGLFRTGSNGSRKGNHSNSGDGEDEDDPYRSEMEDSDNTESPPEPLPLYQQRENYFT